MTSLHSIDPKLEESWKQALNKEFSSTYFYQLKQFLVDEKAKGKIIYPQGKNIFSAFNLTPPDEVRVVILGQDPYHGAGQAHGLCFSVPNDIKPPPSLVNIFKEMKQDLQVPISSSGNLESWAQQGVLLLNATLTVEENKAGSHQKKGWEQFTDATIRYLSEHKTGLIFLLWGNYAKAKMSLIDAKKHVVLTAAHPSPFSAYSGFFGCGHFSKVNNILAEKGQKIIDWSIPRQETQN